MKKRRMNNNILEICDEKNNVVLSITEEVLINGRIRIIFVGELTNEVAHEFEDEIMAVLTVCKNIELDMGKVTYIASMALKTLLSIQQLVDDIDDASMLLRRVSPEVMGVLDETGFSDILQIEQD